MNNEKEIRASQDFAKLRELLRQLVGQPCLRAGYTYGDELELHFGAPRAYKHPKLAEQTKGSWVLGTFATPWMIAPEGLDKQSLVGPSFNPILKIVLDALEEPVQRHEEQLASLSGRRVEKMAVGKDSRALVIMFEGGAVWAAFPHQAEPDPDLPVWELTTPYGMYFQVFDRPFPTWSYLYSDVPAHP